MDVVVSVASEAVRTSLVPRLDAPLGLANGPTADRYRWMVESVNDVIFEADPTGFWTYLNPAWTRILGYEVGDCLGTSFLDHVHPDDRQGNLDVFLETIGSGKTECRFEARYLTADGRSRYMEIRAWIFRADDGSPLGSTGTLTDTTERRLAELELEHRATHDPLTGLPNRVLLSQRIEAALRAGAERPVTLLFLDLDRFKLVNDSLGHDVGDSVLRLVADRLRRVAGPEDVVARFGGDEFVILCEGIDEHAASDRARRVRAALLPPFDLAGTELTLTASIGVRVVSALDAEVEMAGERAQQMVRDADAAMYEAKSSGRDRAALFEPGTRARVVARLDGEGQLRKALERDELILHHQPQLTLGDHRLIGVEALVRWQHPTRGLVYPDDFIPLAEDSGLIAPISRWVLTQACRELAAAGRAGIDLPRISVNVSAQEVAPPLVAEIEAVLSETGADPSGLCLELTESALLADTRAVQRTLDGLASLGVVLSLDDFGTGYSSLAYLQRLPFVELKIDRSFVRRIATAEGAAIVLAILHMADALELETVAEGVERKVEAHMLATYGCRGVQGYRYVRPGPLRMVLEQAAGVRLHAPVRTSRHAETALGAVATPEAGVVGSR